MVEKIQNDARIRLHENATKKASFGLALITD